MPVFETFSKRRKREARGDAPEIYQYDAVPMPLRVQVIHIWRDALGEPPRHNGYMTTATISNQLWETIHSALCREKGVFHLAGEYKTDFENCCQYLLDADNLDDALDIIQFSFRVIEVLVDRYEHHQKRDARIKLGPTDAIAELNERFVEHRFGYQFENGQLVRVDRQFIHAEVVKAALVLLHEPEFEVANADFMKAHEHYRARNYKDAVVAAQRAFESTLKCVAKGIKADFKQTDRASDLIKVVRNKGLFPDYLGAGLDSYVAALKTGLPDVRNNAGGHGAAPDAPMVPGYMAAYAIHLTAANIVLSVEAYKARGKTPKR